MKIVTWHLAKFVFCPIIKVYANCSAFGFSHFLCQVSLLRENSRGLRENCKHKIRTLISFCNMCISLFCRSCSITCLFLASVSELSSFLNLAMSSSAFSLATLRNSISPLALSSLLKFKIESWNHEWKLKFRLSSPSETLFPCGHVSLFKTCCYQGNLHFLA